MIWTNEKIASRYIPPKCYFDDLENILVFLLFHSNSANSSRRNKGMPYTDTKNDEWCFKWFSFTILFKPWGFYKVWQKSEINGKLNVFIQKIIANLFFTANTQDNKNTQICWNNRTTHNVLFHYFSDFNPLWISKEAGKK